MPALYFNVQFYYIILTFLIIDVMVPYTEVAWDSECVLLIIINLRYQQEQRYK